MSSLCSRYEPSLPDREFGVAMVVWESRALGMGGVDRDGAGGVDAGVPSETKGALLLGGGGGNDDQQCRYVPKSRHSHIKGQGALCTDCDQRS